jgi:transcriptional regulator GlxA family with amidase domain
MRVARILVVYLRRSGGQSQYSALLASQAESESEMFNELDRWIAEHLTSGLKVEALAERVHMSPRNFARAYAAKRGRTPGRPFVSTPRGAGLRKRAIASNPSPRPAASAAKSKCVVHF